MVLIYIFLFITILSGISLSFQKEKYNSILITIHKITAVLYSFFAAQKIYEFIDTENFLSANIISIILSGILLILLLISGALLTQKMNKNFKTIHIVSSILFIITTLQLIIFVS